MSVKNITIIFVAFFVAGGSIGYIVFPDFPVLFLQAWADKYSVIATQKNEIFLTRMFFSFLVAFAFVSMPLSAMVSVGFVPANVRAVRILAFALIISMVALGCVLYYQNQFSHLFSAFESEDGFSIKLDMIPYYAIPAISAISTVSVALLYLLVLNFKGRK